MSDEVKALKDLNCPICGKKMLIRVTKGQHVNSVSKAITNHNFYQYYCTKCNDEHSGWTTTQSDELSIKPVKQ